MVYPFDAVTGAELSDNAITKDGFKLDMAKSRYLTIDVTRSILKVGSDGLITEDVRFNRPAKDSDSYTEEGIYTFNVNNLYTDGDPTIKTIYVGTDKYLLALAKNKLTVSGLNEKIAKGAVINDDGSMAASNSETNPEIKGTTAAPTATKSTEIVKTNTDGTEAASDGKTTADKGNTSTADSDSPNESKSPSPLPFVILGTVAVGGIGIGITMKKRNGKMEDAEK